MNGRHLGAPFFLKPIGAIRGDGVRIWKEI
jgi:hypothetical protein